MGAKLTKEEMLVELRKPLSTGKTLLAFGFAIFVVMPVMLAGLFQVDEMLWNSKRPKAVVEKPASRPVRPDSLTAGISTRSGWIQIRNEDKFDWKEVKVSVNDELLTSGFYCRVGDLKAGAKIERPLNDFADGSGARFNVALRRINHVSVTAKTQHGTLFVTMQTAKD